MFPLECEQPSPPVGTSQVGGGVHREGYIGISEATVLIKHFPCSALSMPFSIRLLLTSKLKVSPDQIVFAQGGQENIPTVGWHLCYVRLPGGEGVGYPCYSDEFARLRLYAVSHQSALY